MNAEVAEKIAESFRGAITEIGAGQILCPTTASEHIWNDACERAKRICAMYRDGRGLFQKHALGTSAPKEPAPDAGREGAR